jgi:TP901 family phage tail tape measure protein
MTGGLNSLGVRTHEVGLVPSIQAAVKRINRAGIVVRVRASDFTQPLGKMSAKANEFTKSLEASNARVIAFGASAAIIGGVTTAFSQLVIQAAKVEKILADINAVLDTSSENLRKFGDGLFNVARNTSQALEVAAEAALEFSRQGLSMEETLKRTNDALILTRLTGLAAADSVKGLTAAVNGFADAGLTTTEIINKLAAVDVKFAVSADDLINALARAGAVAQDAGVDFNSLVGAVTSAQQITARGGAVIGNSFKTIFTRLQRSSTLDRLQELGIAVRDLQGNTLPAINILTELSRSYDTLGAATRAAVAEQVGGVFQINVLKAALKDLGKENSLYAQATQTASDATNEAYRKNEMLQKTLSSIANQTLTTVRELTANLGDLTIAPALTSFLDSINGALSAVSDLFGEKEGESIGSDFAKGLARAVGNVLSGPGMFGLVLIFGKLFGQAFKFAKNSVKDLLQIKSIKDQELAIQESIVDAMLSNVQLQEALLRLDGDQLKQEQLVLNVLKDQTKMLEKQRSIASSIAPGLRQAGVQPNLIVDAGKNKGATARTNKSSGHIPTAIEEIKERAGARQGGYIAGPIATMSIPTVGRVVYNKNETIKQFDGMSQPAIMPPEKSKAGKEYKNDFSTHHGFDPYSHNSFSAGGFIPNYSFSTMNQNRLRDSKSRNRGVKNLNLEYFYPAAGQGGGTIFKMYKDIVRSADSGQPYTNILAGEIIGPRIPKMIVEGKKMLDKARLSGKKIPKMSIQGTIFPSMLTRKIDKFASDRKDGYIHPPVDYIPGEESEVRKYLKSLGADPESHDTVKLQNVYKGGYDTGFIPSFALKAGLIPGTNILRLPTAKMINETTASDFKGNKIKGWQTLEATVDNVQKHAQTYRNELSELKKVGVDLLQRKMYFSNQSQHIPVKDRKKIARQQKKMTSMKGFAGRNQHKITGNSQEDALFKSSLENKGYYPTWTGAYTAEGRQKGKGDENFKVDFFAPGRKPIESKYGKYTAPNLIAKSIRLYSDSYIEEFLSRSGRSDLSENMRKGKLKDSTNMLTSLGYKDVNADMVLRAGLFNGYLPDRKNNVNQNLRTVKELEGRETVSGYSAMSSSEMFDEFSSNSDRNFPGLEKMSKDGIWNNKNKKSRKKESFYHRGIVPNFSKNWAQGKSKSSDKNQGRKRSPQAEIIKAIRATLSKRGIKRSAMAEDKILFAAEKYISATKSRDYPGGYVNVNGNKINLNEITLALKKHGDYHPSFDDTVEFDGSKNHKDNLMFEELEQKRLPNFARYGMSSLRSPIMFKNGNEGSFGRSYLATTSKSGKLFLLKDGHKPFSDYMKKMGKPEPKLKEGAVGGREGYWVNSGADDVKTWAELPNTKLLASQEKRRAEAQAIENDRKARLNPGVFDPVLSNGKIFFSDGSSGSVNPDSLSKKMGKEYKHVEVDKRALHNYAKENKITKKSGGTESTHLGNAFNKILNLPRSEFLKMKHIVRPRMQTDGEKDLERKMNAPSKPIKWDVRDNQKGKKQYNLKADDTTFRQFSTFLLDQGVPKRSVDNIHKALANKQAHLDKIVKEARDKRSMGRGRGVFFDAAKKQESFEKGFSIPTDGLFIKNLNQMVRDFNKTVYNSDGFIPNFMFGNEAPEQSTLYPTKKDLKIKQYNNALKDFLEHQDNIKNKAWSMADFAGYINNDELSYPNLGDTAAGHSVNILKGKSLIYHSLAKSSKPLLEEFVTGLGRKTNAQSIGAAYEKLIEDNFGVQSLGHNAPIDYKNLGQKVNDFKEVRDPSGNAINEPKYTLLNSTKPNSPVEAAGGTGHTKQHMGRKGPRFAAQNPTGLNDIKATILSTLKGGPTKTKEPLTIGTERIVELTQKGQSDEQNLSGYDPKFKAFQIISEPSDTAFKKTKNILRSMKGTKQVKDKSAISSRVKAQKGNNFNINLFGGYGKSAHLVGSQNMIKLEQEIEQEINKQYKNQSSKNKANFSKQVKNASQNTFEIKYDKDILDLATHPITKSHGHIPNFSAWNPLTKNTQSIAKQGGLATNKFDLAKIIQNSPFKDLLRRHYHWNNFPEKHKKRLNEWLRSQGYTNRTLQGWGVLSRNSGSIAKGATEILTSSGHIPNFANPLGDAISREKEALRERGSAADIYIDQDNRLKNPKNPAGLLVANTRDEPKSGSQGVNRAISMGMDPKTHGASSGVVPNFASSTKGSSSSNKSANEIKDTGKAMKEAGDASGDLMMKMMGLTTLTYALDGAMGEASETASGFQKAMGVVNAAIMGASQAAMLAMVVPKGTSAKGRRKLNDGFEKAKNAYGSKNQSTGSRLKAGLGGAGMMAKGAGGMLMGALGPLGMAAAALIPIFSALKEQFGLFKSNIENIGDSLNAARKQQDLLNQATSSLSSEQQNAKSIIELESKGRNLSSEQMNELHKLRIQEIQNQGKLQGSLESVSANFDLSEKQLKLLSGSYADQQKLLKQLESAQVRYIASLELRKTRAENREKLGDTDAGLADFLNIFQLGDFQKTLALGKESADNIARGEADTFYETYMSGKINEGNAQEVNKQISGIVSLNLSKLRGGDAFDYEDFARDDEFQSQFSNLAKTLGYENNPEEGPDLNEFKRRMSESIASVNAQSYYSGIFGTNLNPFNSGQFTQDERETSKTFKQQLQRRVSGAKEDDAAKIAKKSEQVNLIDIANESNKMAKQISFEQDRALSLAKQRLKIEQKIFEQDQARLGLTDEIEDFLGVLNVDQKVDRQFDRKETAIDQKAEQDIKSLRIDARAESKKFLEDKIKTDRLNNSMFDPMTGINQDKVEKLLREIADNTDPNSKATSKEEIDFANKFERSAIEAMKGKGIDPSSFNKEKELTEQLNKAIAKRNEINANYKDDQYMRKRMTEQNPEASEENIQQLFNERIQARADNPILNKVTRAQEDFTSRYTKGFNQVMADFRERKQVLARPDAIRIYEQSSDYKALEKDMQNKIQSLVEMSISGSNNQNNEGKEQTKRLSFSNTLYNEAERTISRANKSLLSKTELELQKSLKIQERITKEAQSPAHLNQLYSENPRANPKHISSLEEQIKDLSKPPADTTLSNKPEGYKISSTYDIKEMDEYILKTKERLKNLNFSNGSTLSGSTNPDAATDNINSIKNQETEEAIASIPPVSPSEKALMNNASSPERIDIQARAKEQDTADRIKLVGANAQAKGVKDGTRIAESKLKDKANSLTNREQTILPDLFQQQQIQGIKYDSSPSVSNPGVFGQTGDMPLVNPNDPIYPINQARMGKDLALPVSTPDKIDGKSTEARAKSEAEINKIMSEIFIQLRDHKKIAGGVVDKTKARSMIIDGLLQLDDDIERAKAIELINTSNVTTYTDHEIDLIKQGLNQKQATLSDQEQAARQEKKANKDDLDLQKLSESFRNRTNAGLQETLRIRGDINNYEERVSDAVQHNLGVQSGFAKLSSEMLNVQIGKLRSMERDGSLAKHSESLANEELGREEKQRILSTAMLKAKNNLLDGTERGVQIAGDNFDAQEEERRLTLIAAQNKLKLSNLSEKLYKQAETESSIKVAQLAIENKLLAQKTKLYETTEALTKEVEGELEQQRRATYNTGLRNQETNRLNDQMITNPNDPYFGMTGFQANAQQRAQDLNTAQTSQVKNARADFQLYTGRGNELRASETRLQLLQFQKQQNIENGKGRMFSDTIAVRIAEVNVELDRFNETLANTAFDSVKQGFRDMMDTMASGTAEMSDVFGAFLGSIVSAISDKLIDRATAQITSGLFDIIGIGEHNKGGIVGYNRGGYAMGGKSSQTPAMLTAGEYVVRKKVVDRLGSGTLDKMNKTGSLDSLYQEPSTNNFDISTSSGAPGMAFMNEGGWLSRQWDTAKSTFSPFTSSSSDSSWGRVAKGSGMLLGSSYGAYEEAQKNAADNAPEAPQAPSTAVLNTTSDLSLDPSSSSMSPSMRQGGNSYAQQYGDYLLKKYDYDVQQNNQAVEAKAGFWQGMANQFGVALGGAAVGKFTSSLGAAWDTRWGSEATVERWNKQGIHSAADLAEKKPNSFGYYKNAMNDYRDRMGFDSMSTDDITSGKPVTGADMLRASNSSPSCSGGVCSTSDNLGMTKNNDYRSTFHSPEQIAFSDALYGRANLAPGLDMKNSNFLNNGYLKKNNGGIIDSPIQGYSSGGKVYGPGGIDKVGPVMLDKGEYVVRASSVNSIEKQFPGFFDQLNAMRFNQGGSVGGTQSKSESSSQQSGNVTVNINVASDGSSSSSSSGGGSEQQMASKIKDAVVGIIAQEKRVGGMLSG